MNLPTLEGYVIYNPATSLYSRGGVRGEWSKKPKIWSSIGHLKNHLSLYIITDFDKNNSYFVVTDHYKDCIVVNIIDGSEPFKIHDYLLEKAEQSAKRYDSHLCHYSVRDEWK